MKLLVIQEQHFIKMPNGEVWVDSQSDSKFWERYLNVFDEIIVCGRFSYRNKYLTDNLIRSDRDRVTFFELPDTRGVSSLLKNFGKIRKIMIKAMKESDCIIFRAPSPISMIAYPLAKKSNKPFATEIMNNPYTHFSPEAMNNFYQPLLRKLIVSQTKSLCKTANGVSYVTEKVLQNLYPSRARLCGETLEYFESSYSTIRLENNDFSLKDFPNNLPNPIIMIHTGKMEDYRKGQDIFIKIIAKLRKKGYNVQGILVGDGSKKNEFMKLAQDLKVYDYLDFVGWKAGFNSVKIELNRSHIFIFPSKGEGLPRSIIEAMSQGLLCFGSKIDGICELLDEECLVPDFNEDSFVNKIEPFLLDWEKALNKRKIQFEYSKRYEYSILTNKRNEFYKKLRRVVESNKKSQMKGVK